jgi:hypothetical protein
VKTPASSKQSTGIHRIHLSGNRVVVIDTKDLSDRSAKDLVGISVANSQDPDTLLANLRKVPGVLSATFG